VESARALFDREAPELGGQFEEEQLGAVRIRREARPGYREIAIRGHFASSCLWFACKSTQGRADLPALSTSCRRNTTVRPKGSRAARRMEANERGSAGRAPALEVAWCLHGFPEDLHARSGRIRLVRNAARRGRWVRLHDEYGAARRTGGKLRHVPTG
jgi:hypothetical protein